MKRMINFQRISRITFVLILVMTLFLSACAPVEVTVTETPELITEEVPTPEIIEETQPPTEVISESTVLLVTNPDVSAARISSVTDVLEVLAADSGLDLQSVSTLTPETLAENITVVVTVGSHPSINEFAASNLGIKFIAVDDPQVQPAQNVSVMGGSTRDQEYQAFMAGYLAAVVSSDYKVAAIIPENLEQTQRLSDAFWIGARFFCGICRPLYPPYNVFPYLAYLPVENASEGFQPVIDSITTYGVEVLFVAHPLATPEMLSYLAERGVKVIGDRSPDMPRNNWVGTVTADPVSALEILWKDLFSESSGENISAFITVIDTDSDLLSEGRLRLFKETAADLLNGLISAEPVP